MPPAATTPRSGYFTVVTATVVVAALLALLTFVDTTPADDGLTPVDELTVGDCFAYPGDGVEPVKVQTVDCKELHYAEIVGIALPDDRDSCVSLFESYTKVENYWDTGLILGFIDVNADWMLCYSYGPTDTTGSIRA